MVLLGLSNTKILESEYLLQELKMFLKSLEADSLGRIHSSLFVFSDLALKHIQVGPPARSWGRS